jgi:hypothetical protein
MIIDAKFDLVIDESIKDVSRLYKLEEVTDEIFLPYFEHNLQIFGYDELITEFGLKNVWDAVKNTRFTPRGQDKALIFGRDSHALDAAKYGTRKAWEGTRNASSWLADKWRERQARINQATSAGVASQWLKSQQRSPRVTSSAPLQFYSGPSFTTA